jgi:FKBP-type peptidyl-prolyl cis-trans isomerase FkpA
MKRLVSFFCLTVLCVITQAQQGFYTVPDSVKATGFITDIIVVNKKDAKRIAADIRVNNRLFLGFVQTKTKKQISWYFRVRQQLKEMMQGWDYEWQYNETYKLLVMTASDSASNSSIWSGYIFLPNEKKWKLLATQTFNDTTSIKNIAAVNIDNKKYSATYSNRWLLRSNNTWKALDSQTTKPPVLRPFSNIDSVAQQKIEEDNLRDKLPADSVIYKDGIFYQTIKEGTGRLVQLTDTVVVHYKGWLFSNGNVFDQTKEKPATFPLSRLIRGWQIAVPQCKVGGTIRLFIPSGNAYGMRTFATDIPPNSTLVFDVEVVEVKEKI